MKIKLFYDDEYIECKEDYSYQELTVDSWEDFWKLWTDFSQFIRCDSFNNKIAFLRKDRVTMIIRDDNDEF